VDVLACAVYEPGAACVAKRVTIPFTGINAGERVTIPLASIDTTLGVPVVVFAATLTLTTFLDWEGVSLVLSGDVWVRDIQ